MTNMTITGNLFKATNDAYHCLHLGYAPSKPYPNGGNLNYSGNVFEKGRSGKCGDAGPVYDWNNSAGSWCNNKFDDGHPASRRCLRLAPPGRPFADERVGVRLCAYPARLALSAEGITRRPASHHSDRPARHLSAKNRLATPAGFSTFAIAIA